MPRKKHTPEEIVANLRQVDVLVSQGSLVSDTIRQIGVTEATYYRCRQEYGGLKLDQAKRLPEAAQVTSRCDDGQGNDQANAWHAPERLIIGASVKERKAAVKSDYLSGGGSTAHSTCLPAPTPLDSVSRLPVDLKIPKDSFRVLCSPETGPF